MTVRRFPRSRQVATPYPATLDLNFLGRDTLDLRITFARADATTCATYFDSAGVLQTAAANIPRFGYNPATLELKGFLVEATAQNIAIRSEDFTNGVAWVNQNSNDAADQTTAPDGTVTADSLVQNGATASHGIVGTIVVVSGSTYTWSVFAKQNTSTVLQLTFGNANSTFTGLGYANFDLSTGVVSATGGTLVDYDIENCGNGWFRCWISATATASAATNNWIVIANSTTYTRLASYLGDDASGFFIWGAQVEVGAFPTSYIPTTSSAVTRAADVASVNTLSPWYNATEYTLYYEGIVQTNSNGIVYTGIGDTFDNTAYFSRTAPNQYVAVRSGGNSQTGPLTSNFTPTINVPFKMAAGIKANDFALCINGGTVATDTSGAVPLSAVRLGIGNAPWAASGGNQGQQWIRRIAYYPTRLSNTDLQAITA